MKYDSSDTSTESTTTLSALSPRTKKILGSIIAAGVLLAGALFIYAVLVGPSKEPYREALNQYVNVKDTKVVFMTQGSQLGAGSATSEQYSKNVKAAQDLLKSLQVENEALAKSIVLTEGEGKVLYDAFDAKLQKYITYYEQDIHSMATLRPVMFTCLNKLETIEESIAAANEFRTCAESLAALELAHTDYKTIAQSLASIYRDIATNVTSAAEMTDKQGADKTRHESLEADRKELITELEQASATFSKSVQVHRAEVEITKEAMALEAYLDGNSRVF